MKWQIAIALMVVVAVVSCDEKYTTKYDNINYKEILENKPLLHNYIKCTLDKGRCTAEGNELKSKIKDALQTGCIKCSDKQKQGARDVIQHLEKHEPEYFAELRAKYDPNNEFESTMRDFLAGKI
ncbi:ejaculatory bulb-specific protein 3 [Manduca sexta]|uniref:Uncharacterized protein n=1 Tax=Manduca sexta TaxID=7130 RepID=Q3LB51_MANSE|nr:ejaculatory bulb-specific protein 3 [Manduca sexta]XP_030028673.1 ejaculatory bulb-specific protein 3 [Manduca sexta]KAG6454395.1 hypothetical protein O3G_MSEX008680 [Manduca sexta]KAG6454396.1 hypothetical protein O3G_MSEX008680 [Manduca sexta]CAJ01502.1 hypothetical protein [Manduca sexta]